MGGVRSPMWVHVDQDADRVLAVPYPDHPQPRLAPYARWARAGLCGCHRRGQIFREDLRSLPADQRPVPLVEE